MKQLRITQRITDRTSSQSLNQYLADIRAIEPFETPEDEYLCAVKAANGDSDALDELVLRNLRFVVSVAKQYANAKLPLEELIDEGNVGLIEAANRFEPSRGFKFISYGVWYVRRNINEYISQNSRTIRIPTNKVSKLNKMKKEIDLLEQINGRSVTINDLISEDNLELNFDDINLLMSIESMNVMSLDSPLSHDEDSNSMIDVIEDVSLEPTDHLVNDNDYKKIIAELIDELNDKQREVITLNYGLDGSLPLSLVDIGNKMNMSREGVRQVREKALRKIRVNINKMGIKSEIFK